MRLHPQITHGDQALASQPVIRHPGLGGQRPGQVPIALGAERRQYCLPFARPQGQEVAHLSADATPLFPVTHAHPPTQPVVPFGDRTVVVRDAEVTHPPADVLGELVERPWRRPNCDR